MIFTIKLGKIKFKITFNSIFVLLYFLYCSIPNIQFKVDAKGTYMVLLLILPYIAYFTFIKCYLRKSPVIVFSILTIMIGIMYSVFTSHINTPYPLLTNIIVFSKIFTPLAMYLVIRRKNDIAEMNFIFVGMTIILVYLLYHTITNSTINSDIVYQITKMNYENFDSSRVAMSMDQSYALVPIACLLLVVLFGESILLLRFLACAGVISIVIALFVSQFTSAILILLICISIYMIKGSKGFYKILVSIMLIVLFVFLPTLLLELAKNVESKNIAVRLIEVATFLKTGDATGYNMSARIGLYKQGIIAFLRSPLWGNYNLGFDPHSSFIQLAADIGLLGVVFFIYLLEDSKKRIIHGLRENSLGFNIAYIALIITGVINPIVSFPTMFFTVFCYVPLGGILLIDKSRLGEKRI